ncbi:MAG: hypothetical protein AAF658_03330 [Myxococcota bacterium]
MIKNAFLACAAVVLLFACSDDPVANDEFALSTATECPPEEAPDGNGTCRRRCVDDSQCFNGQSCDTGLGFCLAQNASNPNANDNDSGPDAPDTGSGDDGNDNSNNTTGGGTSGPECDDLFSCGLGQVCVDGACDSLANNPPSLEDILDGIDLSGLDGVVATCESTSDCGPLVACVSGICVGCLDSLQCDGQQSCIRGVCVEPVASGVLTCLTEGCGSGETCFWSTGECVTACSGNEECAEGESCLPGLNGCVPEFGCEQQEDCADGLFCVAGLCAGCRDDGDCGQNESCLGLACVPNLDGGPNPSLCEAVMCESDELCDPADGSCYPATGTCGDDSDCPAGLSCGFLSLCTGCAEASDCRPQQDCLFGTCTPELDDFLP